MPSSGRRHGPSRARGIRASSPKLESPYQRRAKKSLETAPLFSPATSLAM
jgi:hypothetical protein